MYIHGFIEDSKNIRILSQIDLLKSFNCVQIIHIKMVTRRHNYLSRIIISYLKPYYSLKYLKPYNYVQIIRIREEY